MESTLIFNVRLVDSEMDARGAVLVRGGKIDRVLRGDFLTEEATRRAFDSADAKSIDGRGLCLMPAFVDTHAHFRYPGQTQKEDLDSGLLAAESGGFGTVVLMPNTSPVVSEPSEAEKIMESAAQKSRVKAFQTVSLTRGFDGFDTSHLDALDSKKIPVISEDGRDVASASVMLCAMKKATARGAIVACHSEDVDLAAEAKKIRGNALSILKSEGVNLGTYVRGNPAFLQNGIASGKIEDARALFEKAHTLLALAEDIATERNLSLASFAKAKIHICHCSTKKSILAVKRAKEAGERVSVEVTPHHLALSLLHFPLSDLALVNPPIRSESDRAALIESLKNGTADCIGTDHAPHTLLDKAAGAPGFPGLETAFGVCHTVLCKNEGISLSRLSALMSANAAKLLNVNEGRIVEGMDAKLVLVDENEKWTVDSKTFKTKGRSSPFDGMELTGRVKQTLLF